MHSVRWKKPQRLSAGLYTLNTINSTYYQDQYAKWGPGRRVLVWLYISVFSATNFLVEVSIWFITSKRESLSCCWLLWTIDRVLMTSNSQSQTTTSRTISISLTLQAHPLSRMKKVTCWLSTFHLQSAVQRAPWWPTSAPHCSIAIQLPPALRQSSSSSTPRVT